MNALHSSMKITDEFYSNLNDGEVESRISSLGKDGQSRDIDQEAVNLIEDFLIWKQKQVSRK